MSRFPQIESRAGVERLSAARGLPRLAFVGWRFLAQLQER